VIGKPTGHDLRERKVTLPLIGALQAVSAKGLEEIRSFFTLVEPTDSDIEHIVHLVKDAGGLEYARRKAEAYSRTAVAALEGLPRGPAVEGLMNAVVYATGRSR
jgi:octaprenyl-diphosphate synthase